MLGIGMIIGGLIAWLIALSSVLLPYDERFLAFIAGLSVHYGIGYTDFIHLLPAWFAFVLYLAGLVLLYPYMHGVDGGD
ncbi:hypothetical protein [Cohnella hashimotonis]|uniref:Uncharacterized protein n=1 Tax=Cohnella hashimotonis TaxID=2826895 RepID=A0ABT6TS26_9BACL|nr:hypothetical protein [Cohnella hashimotonis]MDI4649656.1 hypothetical protein [Cohnella hashimotonis]